MVNFGASDSVPERFRNRRLHEHNAQVTLMRTTVEENRAIARFIAQRLNRAGAPWTLLIPEGGLSLLDVPGQPFYDPAANAALFDELERVIEIRPGRTLNRRREAINDPVFAAAAIAAFRALAPKPA